MTAVAWDRVLPECGNLLRLAGEDTWFFSRRDSPRWIVVSTLGAEILSLCNGRRSLYEIAELIGKRYDCSLAQAQRDALSFWLELEASQFFVEPSPSSEALPELRLDSVEVYVTTRCNQSCTHCGVQGAFPEGDMPPGLFREVVRQAAALGASKIVVTGGEPLVRKDLLELLEAVKDTVRLKLLTNGTLIGAAEARQLARLGAAVQVSLDGGSREVHDSIRGEGAFDAAVEGIRLLRDSGVGDLSVNFTIQQGNAKDVSNLLHLAESEGIRKVSLMPLIPGVEGERRFRCASPDSIFMAKGQADAYGGAVAAEVLISGIGKDSLSGRPWCLPGESPAISPDGVVFPCPGLVHTPFIAGKLPEDTLEQAIHSSSVEGLRRICQDRVEKIEECASCVWKHFCRAGCPAFAYHQRGSLLAKDCFCEARKRVYRDLFLGGQDDECGFAE